MADGGFEFDPNLVIKQEPVEVPEEQEEKPWEAWDRMQREWELEDQETSGGQDEDMEEPAIDQSVVGLAETVKTEPKQENPFGWIAQIAEDLTDGPDEPPEEPLIPIDDLCKGFLGIKECKVVLDRVLPRAVPAVRGEEAAMEIDEQEPEPEPDVEEGNLSVDVETVTPEPEPDVEEGNLSVDVETVTPPPSGQGHWIVQDTEEGHELEYCKYFMTCGCPRAYESSKCRRFNLCVVLFTGIKSSAELADDYDMTYDEGVDTADDEGYEADVEDRVQVHARKRMKTTLARSCAKMRKLDWLNCELAGPNKLAEAKKVMKRTSLRSASDVTGCVSALAFVTKHEKAADSV
jgi:hypothetical protein